jgi:hypothetical protein
VDFRVLARVNASGAQRVRPQIRELRVLGQSNERCFCAALNNAEVLSKDSWRRVGTFAGDVDKLEWLWIVGNLGESTSGCDRPIIGDLLILSSRCQLLALNIIDIEIRYSLPRDLRDTNALGPNTPLSAVQLLQQFIGIRIEVLLDDDFHLLVTFGLRNGSAREDRDCSDIRRVDHLVEDARSHQTRRSCENEMHFEM